MVGELIVSTFTSEMASNLTDGGTEVTAAANAAAAVAAAASELTKRK